MLKEIQKRLPERITLEDETDYDFTEDEYLNILCWIKYFREHYEIQGMTHYPKIMFPIISKRIRLDLGIYIQPGNDGKHNIYISKTSSTKSLKQFVNKYKL